ncbi:calcium-activated chloride channel regulator 4 precursor [Bos taurus]|uniref:Calcium-activated chloride channel regulator 1 n=2 Tax=Bos TaxID=9903 RepID=Q3SYU0_BOVIN|nr:calcium-activated chloride channel regulator 4 precursor [Bos taurus]AAI03388.1 Chloride channel accessory 4 [Bos taurus]DAA31315.1 TPA: chloride channel accessory 4 [Bos taurus]
MGLFRSFVFLLMLYLLQGSNTSLVRLNNNGYEGIIIAIDPAVPEDETLIEKIQNMVIDASTYLFEATEKRFFFKNVSILIPENWKSITQYKRPKHESYKHADVRVAPPTLPGRDEPYTKQFTACEEKGEYIHFTPDFVLGNKQNEFGPSGRLLVHEWAHLRWGVFDEYNDDEPFYRAKSRKIEATRCSTSITGLNRVYMCEGGSCVTNRECRIDSKTKLYEKNCQFFPDKDQTEKTSIMFMQGIDSVTEFCNEKSHNQEAPTLQNKMCNYRSTWEVISNSEDFKNTTAMLAPPPPPVFSLLKFSERIVCLVLDKSGSMAASNRLNRMNQAAQHFLLQTVENGSWVGMVHFDSSASIKSNLIQIISSSERRKLLESLPTAASGGTSICSGIESGFQAIRNADFQIDGSEIVLLTDGEDSTAKSCIEKVKQSGAIIHFIALGPDAAQAVKEMSIATGGKYIYASDEGQNNGLIDAFAALASENIDASQQSLQLESKGLKLNSNDWMNGTVIIDSTVGKDTFFLITWNQQLPSIYLFDPDGISMGTFIVDSASKMAYLSIKGATKVGVWTYNIQAKASSETLTITVNSRAANSSVPPITVNAKMNKDTNSYPSPLIVYAEILQGYLPILGANVTAFIESKFGETEVLELLDNGAGADSFKNDGVYSRYFTTYKENGPYNLKVRAHGGENAVTWNLRHPLNRAAYIPGWVVDGNIEGNPPRPENDEDTQTNVESFTRIATGGAFVVSNVPQSPSFLDLFPPSQITDLEATSNEDEINLTWTAPGDDFDVGKVQEYIIRISESILDLRDNFDDALQVNTTALLPKEANSKETFTFKPGNISEENETHIFIAIQSVDKSNLTSKVSNIVQVALFVQEDYIPDEIHPDTSPDKNPPKSGLSISALVLLVVGSVVIVSLILSITICIVNKRRNPRRPRTGF